MFSLYEDIIIAETSYFLYCCAMVVQHMICVYRFFVLEFTYNIILSVQVLNATGLYMSTLPYAFHMQLIIELRPKLLFYKFSVLYESIPAVLINTDLLN